MKIPISLDQIFQAKQRVYDIIRRTPLVKLDVEDSPTDIYLKLENLQPTGAFKLRGSANAIKSYTSEELENGVYAYSSGNHGQGLAYCAHQQGVKCTIWTTKEASPMKIDSMKRYGAEIRTFSYPKNAEEWQSRFDKMHGEMDGIHISGQLSSVMAGYGTIGLEIIEDLPDVDAVFMPFGGGSNLSGTGSAIRALKPEVKLLGCEIDTATPLASSLEAGESLEVERTPSFINAIGYPMMMPATWERMYGFVSGAVVVSLREVCDAVRLMVERNKIVAEGAGAVAVAGALSAKVGSGKVVCVVTGGNIDSDKLVTILNGGIPNP